MARYDAAVQLDPKCARAHLNRGNILLASAEIDEARGAYELAVACDPHYAAAHFNLGNLNLRAGATERALLNYQSAIAIRPDFADAFIAMANALDDMGRISEAIENYERALAINPSAHAFHFALGQLDLLQGRLAEAQAEFQKQGTEANRRMGAAMVEHAGGHDRQSLATLKELIAKNADDSAYQVADVYAWRGEKDKAFEWLRRAYQQRDSGLNGIAWDPLLSSLKDDPRYGALLKQLGLSR